uniref:Intradiol ring-cleavage dioxygenases domain-containing protein n=1 Tax=Phytophthora ramorum TaxID=164328 RepID=H3GU58_PHYRM
MVHFTRWLVLASAAALVLSDFVVGHSSAALTMDQRTSRKLFVENGRRLMKNCIRSDAGQELKEKAATRRLAMLKNPHSSRRRLDATTALATNHESSRTGLSSDTNSSDLFSGEPVCLLEPESTEGPYYVAGELIRSDIREDQPGIDLYVDLQFVDVNTCSPVNELYVDIWHANAAGVYSGVVARTNGDADDAANIDTTFHRGLSPTDSDGFVSFTTKFPGLYAGRATHIHIMTHSGGTVLTNGTYSGGRVSHVGQLFFDQSLITDVQATGAYADNPIPVTTNEDDFIALQSAANDFDPFVQYARLGDSIEDGLLSWISVGVDMTKDNSVSAAGRYTGDGGVPTSDGGTTSNSPGSRSPTEPNDVSDGSSASGDAGNGAAKLEQFGVMTAVVSLVLLNLLAL